MSLISLSTWSIFLAGFTRALLHAQKLSGGVVAHKILLSAPVPWIGDLGLGDWGLGLDNTQLCLFTNIEFLEVDTI